MITTTTEQHRGHVPGRARRVAAGARRAVPTGTSWRHESVSRPATCPPPGVDATRLDVVGAAVAAIPTTITTTITTAYNPAGFTGLMTVKRPARHLRTRAT